MLGSTRIDRMAADIRNAQNLLTLTRLSDPYRDFDDLRHVTAVVEVARDPERCAWRQLAFPPTGLLRHQLENGPHASGIHAWAAESRPASRPRGGWRGRGSRSKQFQPESQWIFPAAWATSSTKG
jgi:hypothetical protein